MEEKIVYLLMCRDIDELIVKVFAKEEDALSTLASERRFYENEDDCVVVGDRDDMFFVYNLDEDETKDIPKEELMKRDDTCWWVEGAPFFDCGLRVGLNVEEEKE